MEDEETRKAIESVDRMEDESAKKRKRQKEEGKEESEDDVIICPNCMSVVTEADFTEDPLGEATAVSIIDKIACPKCNYVGAPIEVSKEEYLKTLKKE